MHGGQYGRPSLQVQMNDMIYVQVAQSHGHFSGYLPAPGSCCKCRSHCASCMYHPWNYWHLWPSCLHGIVSFRL